MPVESTLRTTEARKRYIRSMTTISQRELRNDNAQIMRRVEAGERFTVTRRGKPIADVVPHVNDRREAVSFEELSRLLGNLPPWDIASFEADEREFLDARIGNLAYEDAWDRPSQA